MQRWLLSLKTSSLLAADVVRGLMLVLDFAFDARVTTI